jgi:hypothetical protein
MLAPGVRPFSAGVAMALLPSRRVKPGLGEHWLAELAATPAAQQQVRHAATGVETLKRRSQRSGTKADAAFNATLTSALQTTLNATPGAGRI